MMRMTLLATGLLFCILIGLIAGTLTQGVSGDEFLLQGPAGNTALQSMQPKEAWMAGVRLVAAALVILFIISLIVKSTRKQVLAWLLCLAVLLLLMTVFARPPDPAVISLAIEAEVLPGEPKPAPELPVIEFDNVARHRLPAWLQPLFASLLLGGGSVLLWRTIKAKQALARVPPASDSGLLATLADATLHKLNRQDSDFGDAIISCYLGLQKVAEGSFKLPRDTAMTAREHAAILIRRGADATAIDEITSLYEQVRYGRLQAGSAEIERARRALIKLGGTSLL